MTVETHKKEIKKKDNCQRDKFIMKCQGKLKHRMQHTAGEKGQSAYH